MVFALSTDVLQHILDKPETTEMRTALLDSFMRHSLPKKTPLDNKTNAGISKLLICMSQLKCLRAVCKNVINQVTFVQKCHVLNATG